MARPGPRPRKPPEALAHIPLSRALHDALELAAQTEHRSMTSQARLYIERGLIVDHYLAPAPHRPVEQ